jgi:hypothetical protein
MAVVLPHSSRNQRETVFNPGVLGRAKEGMDGEKGCQAEAPHVPVVTRHMPVMAEASEAVMRTGMVGVAVNAAPPARVRVPVGGEVSATTGAAGLKLADAADAALLPALFRAFTVTV